MPPVGLEPTISVGERPQTYALDRAGTGTGKYYDIIILWDHRRICCPSLTERRYAVHDCTISANKE